MSISEYHTQFTTQVQQAAARVQLCEVEMAWLSEQHSSAKVVLQQAAESNGGAVPATSLKDGGPNPAPPPHAD